MWVEALTFFTDKFQLLAVFTGKERIYMTEQNTTIGNETIS
jgi:hypothetical protein